MISDGESGFVVLVNDPKALSQKILYVLRNPKRIEDMKKMHCKIFEMKSTIKSMQRSLSWRLTAPLRWARQIMDSQEG